MKDSLLEGVVEFKNDNIEHLYEQFWFFTEDPKRLAYWNFIGIVEIKVFLDKLYLRGLIRINWFHSKTLIKEIFANAMSLDRFSFVSRLVEFDDNSAKMNAGNLNSCLQLEKWTWEKFQPKLCNRWNAVTISRSHWFKTA